MTNTEILRNGDVLVSAKDGCFYTITQVRVSEAGKLLNYFAVDSTYSGIVVYAADVESGRFLVDNRKHNSVL